MRQHQHGPPLGCSPRMVRKVVAGESSGASYMTTLAELVDTGQARTRPARRRDAQGRVVPVRAGRGTAERTRPPEELVRLRWERVGADRLGPQVLPRRAPLVALPLPAGDVEASTRR
ncbi:hypothetical protein OG218_02160 [Kineococcus sp. NBC_00420]|uniref:hypothetical protein n=1 Tax=Kineococcus sp. NBC_00420 TaxID=2903564 RepID=UPI002E209F84